MQPFDPTAFVLITALIGGVILIASAVSGFLERTSVPHVAVFLVLGLLLGPHGLGLVDFGMRSGALGAVATLSLVLVLFTDALGINPKALRQNLGVAAVLLGPGTVLTAAIIGLGATFLLGVGPAQAAVLGAALASTDPVMMRGLLRRPEVQPATRTALGIESGLNDAVLLPIVVIAMVFMREGTPSFGHVSRMVLDVLVLGPAAGVATGYLGVKLLEAVRGRYGIRRDYESMYVLGVAFTAFAIAESLHASGFMAAFAAGLTIDLVDVELCDCFHDYGEATSTMFLLFSFVLLGLSIIWTGVTIMSPKILAFALLALFARSLVLLIALPRRAVDAQSRRLVVWFGPRGLSSLLLVLLPIFAGIEGSETLLAPVATVVLLSVVVHGGMLNLVVRKLEPVRIGVTESQDTPLVADSELITLDELRRLDAGGIPYRLLDVRSVGSYASSDLTARGSLRIDPERPVESAAERALPKHDWLVAYCA
ncbi:MAG TPA: cation:proton antiporter [Gemmatimonadales bacterium]|nr:cation:proton antiporter [Gemmatimonadales bacterium]